MEIDPDPGADQDHAHARETSGHDGSQSKGRTTSSGGWRTTTSGGWRAIGCLRSATRWLSGSGRPHALSGAQGSPSRSARLVLSAACAHRHSLPDLFSHPRHGRCPDRSAGGRCAMACLWAPGCRWSADLVMGCDPSAQGAGTLHPGLECWGDGPGIVSLLAAAADSGEGVWCPDVSLSSGLSEQIDGYCSAQDPLPVGAVLDVEGGHRARNQAAEAAGADRYDDDHEDGEQLNADERHATIGAKNRLE